MKCVPIFFLVGFSILHLIHVIAVPSAKRNEVERLEVKRAAAISRFIKSKRNAPFKYPWKRRNVLVIHLRKYTKYLAAITKRHLSSAKHRLDAQIAGFHESFYSTLGRDFELLRSYQGSFPGKNWQKQPTALTTGLNEREQIVFKSTVEGNSGEDSAWSTLEVTASAYEMFRQLAQEVLLRIQTFGAAPDADTVFKTLEASKLPFAVKDSHMLKEILRNQAEQDELTSRTFVPIPSAVPSLEPTPGTQAEPSARESIAQGFEDHGLDSGTPDPSDLSLNGVATPTGSVLTFRRLVRFAARI